MSCPDAPSAIIVNSPIAAIRTKARATRFVFKRIVPPYFRVSLVCLSQESLARPRCPVGPPWGLLRVLSRGRAALLVCEMASQKDKRRTTPQIQDAWRARKFQQVVGLRPATISIPRASGWYPLLPAKIAPRLRCRRAVGRQHIARSPGLA